MSWHRPLRWAVVFAVGVSACSDDAVAPEEDPLARFAGSWNASSFVYTSVADPNLSIPVLLVVPNSSVAVVVAADGQFVASLNLGPQTAGETVDIPGTIEHEGDDRITVTFAENPFFSQPLDVTYAFETENTLSWQALASFDFNQDGTPTPAILTVVFSRI